MLPLDENAFRRLYRRHRPAVLRAARQVLGDDAAAEDVTQDVFLTLWRNPARFDPARSPLSSYLTLLARSRAVDAWRSQRALARTLERLAGVTAVEPSTTDAPGAELERDERRRRLRAALAELPREQREAVVLAYWGALRSAEIGRRTGVPAATVRSRVRLGLAKLRPVLGDEPARGTGPLLPGEEPGAAA